MLWPTKKLGEVISTIESGRRPKGGAVSSGVPSLGVEHMNDGGGFKLNEIKYIPENFYGQLQKGIIKKLDVLIAKDGATTGKVSLVNEGFPFKKAAVNEHVFIVRGRQQVILQKFIFYFLFGSIGNRQILKTKHGAAQSGIDQSFVNFVQIPLPPLRTQKQIVERLDKIAEAQKLNDDLIQKADELFQSLLHKELNPAGKDWEIQNLGDVSELVTKGTTPTTYGHQFVSSGTPFLRAEDVNNNKVNHRSVQYYISKETNDFLKRSQTKPNDILITIAGTIGRIGYVPADAPVMNMNQAVAIVRLKKSINYLYVFFLLQGKEIQKKILGAKVMGTITNLSLTNIRNFKVSVPALEVQKQIVQKLSTVQEYKKRLVDQKIKLKELFDSALHKSIRG